MHTVCTSGSSSALTAPKSSRCWRQNGACCSSCSRSTALTSPYDARPALGVASLAALGPRAEGVPSGCGNAGSHRLLERMRASVGEMAGESGEPPPRLPPAPPPAPKPAPKPPGATVASSADDADAAAVAPWAVHVGVILRGACAFTPEKPPGMPALFGARAVSGAPSAGTISRKVRRWPTSLRSARSSASEGQAMPTHRRSMSSALSVATVSAVSWSWRGSSAASASSAASSPSATAVTAAAFPAAAGSLAPRINCLACDTCLVCGSPAPGARRWCRGRGCGSRNATMSSCAIRLRPKRTRASAADASLRAVSGASSGEGSGSSAGEPAREPMARTASL